MLRTIQKYVHSKGGGEVKAKAYIYFYDIILLFKNAQGGRE